MNGSKWIIAGAAIVAMIIGVVWLNQRQAAVDPAQDETGRRAKQAPRLVQAPIEQCKSAVYEATGGEGESRWSEVKSRQRRDGSTQVSGWLSLLIPTKPPETHYFQCTVAADGGILKSISAEPFGENQKQ